MITKEYITELIVNAEPNKLIELDMPQLEWVSFDFDKYEKEYGWIAKYRYPYGVSLSYMHPMRTAYLTKSWKTLKGAKRNFIKAIEYFLNHLDE